jgi:hypothetical protein
MRVAMQPRVIFSAAKCDVDPPAGLGTRHPESHANAEQKL